METEKGSLNIKRCSTPNSLIDNKKGDISVALCTVAPRPGLFSNQFWDELRSYATLNYLIIKVMNNREVGLILVVLAILSTDL